MAETSDAPGAPRSGPVRVREVVVLTTAMLTFISCWRAAAIVLCDMASTVYYVAGIAEHSVGKAAPWFVFLIMLFAAPMCMVYIESCALFVRGGVYRVVNEAMGGALAKISVSALLFDFVLTGPISSVSAGHYLGGLFNSLFERAGYPAPIPTNLFAVFFGLCATAYFWRKNIRGVKESSHTSLVIMRFVTAMGAIMLVWSTITVLLKRPELPPLTLNITDHAWGFLEHNDWARSIGAFGVAIAIGHSILGMSGLETMAQVYREIEHPKLPNLKKTAMIVFFFCLILTGITGFYAVMLIPDAVRPKYAESLLTGLTLYLVGPEWIKFVFQIFVVGIGTMILSGAVNTSMIGANAALARVADDGVLLDGFRKLHPKFGTTYRMIHAIAILQAVVIIACQGNVFYLGEAYAFGVVASFLFETFSLIVLRFKYPRPREWMVPLNFQWKQYQVPVGATLIFLFLLGIFTTNLLTKRIATISGLLFTVCLYILFTISERINRRNRAGKADETNEEFNVRREGDLENAFSDAKPNKVLVAVRDINHLQPLETVLKEVDDETTDVVVLHSKLAAGVALEENVAAMGPQEEKLFTVVTQLAEKYGQTIRPMLVFSNSPYYAMSQAALHMEAQQLVLAATAKHDIEIQLERLAMTFGALDKVSPMPIKIRIVRGDREFSTTLS